MLDDPVVYLQQCEKYEHELLIPIFETFFAQEKICTLNGSKVLIKPNLISAMGGGLACTHPQFLLALVEWLQFSGAKVVIGDSPAFGKAANVLKALHVDKELARRGVKILEFRTANLKKLKCGVEVGVAAEALECDLFINAPKLKAHNQMYVTLAVKNLFGIVKGMRKSLLHMRYGGSDNMFSRIILDLIELLPAHVSVVDGIDVMHREGPIRGTQLHFGCVALSSDPVAIDTSLLNALQLLPSRSPLWLEAQKRGWAGGDIERIRFPLSTPEMFWGAGFEAPEELAPVRFNPFHFFYGNLKRLGLKAVRK
jgi:uncharacterized protein (DUF362 family)